MSTRADGVEDTSSQPLPHFPCVSQPIARPIEVVEVNSVCRDVMQYDGCESLCNKRNNQTTSTGASSGKGSKVGSPLKTRRSTLRRQKNRSATSSSDCSKAVSFEEDGCAIGTPEITGSGRRKSSFVTVAGKL